MMRRQSRPPSPRLCAAGRCWRTVASVPARARRARPAACPPEPRLSARRSGSSPYESCERSGCRAVCTPKICSGCQARARRGWKLALDHEPAEEGGHEVPITPQRNRRFESCVSRSMKESRLAPAGRSGLAQRITRDGLGAIFLDVMGDQNERGAAAQRLTHALGECDAPRDEPPSSARRESTPVVPSRARAWITRRACGRHLSRRRRQRVREAIRPATSPARAASLR